MSIVIKLLCLLWLMATTPLYAHDARPLSITIVEQTIHIYRVIVRVPPSLEAHQAPSVRWPDSCGVQQSSSLTQGLGSTTLLACSGGLNGTRVALYYPDFNPSITTLFRLEPLSGNAITAVIPPDILVWQVPQQASLLSIARDYTRTGITHIWGGIDHLLFVLGLLLLAKTRRKIFYAITGFTLGHSLTLSLATLQWVTLPPALAEALIALSIVFLAAEIARNKADSFSYRFPIVLSFVFGLLHGFGFASVLTEIGLPDSALLTGLVFFNIGVELGQLFFIAAIAVIFTLLGKIEQRWTLPGAIPQRMTAAAYGLGIVATYWFIERTVIAFAL